MMITTLFCLVLHVGDGDTLNARCNNPAQGTQTSTRKYTQKHSPSEQKTQKIRVRLDGIDAPELDQPYGKQARNALSALVLRKQVKLRCHKIDPYQRHVCEVWVRPDGVSAETYTLDVGLALLTQGMAWWYRRYANEQMPQQRGRYEFAEHEARTRGVGLWGGRHVPVPPWKWRAKARKQER